METEDINPTIFVFIENKEVQVGTNADFHPTEMQLMLELAAKKVELMAFQQMIEMQKRMKAESERKILPVTLSGIPQGL